MIGSTALAQDTPAAAEGAATPAAETAAPAEAAAPTEAAAPAETAAPVEAAAPAETAEATSAPALEITAKDRALLDQKLDSYWSVERNLPSLQKRLYERENRLSVGLFAGMLSSEPFYWYVPVGLRASYYFTNSLGIELEGSFTDMPGVLNHNTALSDYLETQRPTDFNATKKEDRFLWRANAMVVWHPLYGKFAFLQRKLSHFDFNLAAGLGVVSVERPDELRESVSSAIEPEVVFGGGVQFFATQELVIRLDGRFYVYRGPVTPANKDSFFTRLQVPVEFLVGASYMF
jgi:outer membrane beta-barrel protein